MGKSTSANWLREMQLPVVDTDQLAKDLVQPGQGALEEIKQVFGPEIVGTDGQLRRQALADQVFADEAKRRLLEAILHPRIRTAWLEAAARWRAERRPLAVVIIPLLYETGAEPHFDATVCVACSPASQSVRLRSRGWSETEIARRVKAQIPVAAKMDRSTFVIWSEGNLAVHQAQLQQIVRSLACRDE